jgi:hypothetical protein
MKKHFHKNFHLVFENDLPIKSFTVEGRDYDVPCVFQIWIRKNESRDDIQKLEPINYTFVKKEDDPDVSFRRVGVYAGNIDTIIDNKSPQSHYFIKFNNFNLSLYEQLRLLNFESCNHTVGPKSISKQELIIKYNDIMS